MAAYLYSEGVYCGPPIKAQARAKKHRNRKPGRELYHSDYVGDDWGSGRYKKCFSIVPGYTPIDADGWVTNASNPSVPTGWKYLKKTPRVAYTLTVEDPASPVTSKSAPPSRTSSRGPSRKVRKTPRPQTHRQPQPPSAPRTNQTTFQTSGGWLVPNPMPRRTYQPPYPTLTQLWPVECNMHPTEPRPEVMYPRPPKSARSYFCRSSVG